MAKENDRNKMDTNKILWWTIAALAVVDSAIIIAGFIVNVEGSESKLCYGVFIAPAYNSSDIHNIILYLPLAWKGNASFPLQVSSIPEGWKISTVNTEYGKMLRVEIEEIFAYNPNNSSEWEYFDVCLKPLKPVNTFDPLSNEYVLKPKFNLTRVDCMMPDQRNMRCFEYDSVIFVKYNATKNAGFAISVHVDGVNYRWKNVWWYKKEYQSEYGDSISADVNNQSGWVRARGKIGMGEEFEYFSMR